MPGPNDPALPEPNPPMPGPNDPAMPGPNPPTPAPTDPAKPDPVQNFVFPKSILDYMARLRRNFAKSSASYVSTAVP